MKEAENEKFVYLNWEDAIKMNPDRIMMELVKKAIAIKCNPFDFSGQGQYPNIYLRAPHDHTNTGPITISINQSDPENPMFDYKFVMFVKENNMEAK
jgi:hypothetical protein